MEKMTKQQKYMQGKKNIGCAVNEELFERFKKELESDGITQKELLEYAINEYLAGRLDVGKLKWK